MFHSKAQKIVVWADIIICLLFSFIFSTPIGALLLIIVISVIVAIVYFEIRGYGKEKAGNYPKTCSTGSGVEDSSPYEEVTGKAYANASVNSESQWKSLYESGLITRQEYAEHLTKK